MKTNSIEHQIAQLLRDGHTEEQIATMIDLPDNHIKAIYSRFLEQRKRDQLKAFNQHSQAVYAMNLQA